MALVNLFFLIEGRGKQTKESWLMAVIERGHGSVSATSELTDAIDSTGSISAQKDN